MNDQLWNFRYQLLQTSVALLGGGHLWGRARLAAEAEAMSRSLRCGALVDLTWKVFHIEQRKNVGTVVTMENLKGEV